jgi:ArsR family transcriptional regulator
MAKKWATRRRPSRAHLDHGCPAPDPARDGKPASGAEADRALARMAKALGHPVRVKIVRFLAKQADCLHGDLAEYLPLAASTISEHLRILKEAGIVRGKVSGPRTCYCVDPEGLRKVKALVDAL